MSPLLIYSGYPLARTVVRSVPYRLFLLVALVSEPFISINNLHNSRHDPCGLRKIPWRGGSEGTSGVPLGLLV